MSAGAPPSRSNIESRDLPTKSRSPLPLRAMTLPAHARCQRRTVPCGQSRRLLLTSAGVKNPSIRDALVDLLGKPIAEVVSEGHWKLFPS